MSASALLLQGTTHWHAGGREEETEKDKDSWGVQIYRNITKIASLLFAFPK